MDTRIYMVESMINSDEKYLVEAVSAPQAIKHVVRTKYRASIPSTKTVAQMMGSGAGVEIAASLDITHVPESPTSQVVDC